MIEKINKNLNRVVSTLKLLISHYEKQAAPRIPLTEIRWSLSCALECVEKQIPKKVNLRHIRKYDGFDDGECPNCGMSVSRDCDGDDVFCPDCGQKLDWSEEE